MPLINRSLDTLMNIIPLLLVFCNTDMFGIVPNRHITPSKSQTLEKIGPLFPHSGKYGVSIA